MALLRAIEIAAFLVFVYGMVTQVALPLFANKPLFPYFTMRKHRKLEKKWADLRLKREEEALRERIIEENLRTIKREQQVIDRLLEEERGEKSEKLNS